MTKDPIEIAWIAGLLEGEGCFHWAKSDSPLISLMMSDEDVILKAKELMNGGVTTIIQPKNPKHKLMYGFKIYGENAINWMRVLLPLMGIRRRGKINEIITIWESKAPSGLDRNICSYGHDISTKDKYNLQGNYKICKICSKRKADSYKTPEYVLAKIKNISIEEAKKLIDAASESIQ